jgi:hypothetical protein
MPIRINLLAAEQAAEEQRRRDPIKRALFGGCALLVLIIGWIGITQIQVSAARGELSEQTNRLARIEFDSRQVRSSQSAAIDASRRIKSLDRYSGNRFLWGNFLDALQHVTVDNIRLTDIRSDQKNSSASSVKLFTTNIVLSYFPAPPAWKFWAKRPENIPAAAQIESQLPNITNAPPFTTNTMKYTLKVTEVSTNTTANFVTTEADFYNMAWAAENITVEIRGRDYGTPAGAGIDEFAKRLTSSPYFKSILSPSRPFRFTERPPQPRPDPQDPVNPNALFVPFTIELVLDTRTFINDETL